MRSIFAVVLVLALGASACYAPDVSNVTWTCDGNGRPNDCPATQQCICGACRWLNDTRDFGDCSQSVPDGGSDAPGPVSGCTRGGGTHLGNNVWACEGPFPRNSAPALCRAGFEICKTADKVPPAACQSVVGFFASAATVYSTDFDKCTTIDPKFISCTTGTYQYRMGCGTSPLIAVLACEHSCSGFSRGIACSKSTPSGYVCGGMPTPQNDQSSSPGFGVLCCPL